MHSITDGRTEEIPYLGIIFEKDCNGYYTKDALLYQDILLYFFEKRDYEYSKQIPDSFYFDDLAGWLVMKKNKEITNYYSGDKAKTTKTSRINATRRKIRKRIDNLRDMAIVLKGRSVKSRKNDQMTSLYGYSDYGKILAWIVKVVGEKHTSNERMIANEEIYRSIQSLHSLNEPMLEYQQMSKYLFKRAFFEKCWKNGIFDKIVSAIIDSLHRRPKVSSLSKILSIVVYEYVRFTNQKFAEKVWESFIEALNSLDKTTRNIVIYYDKLDVERKIYESYQFQSSPRPRWEEVWFENRNGYSKLVLLVFCNNCQYRGPGVVDYYEFKRKAVMLKDGRLIVKTRYCPDCKDKGDILASTSFIV